VRWSNGFCSAVALAFLLLAARSGAASDPEDGIIAYLALTGSYWQVWTVSPDGTSSRQVTDSPYEKTSCSWFPDGRHVLVSSLGGKTYRVDIETGEESLVEIPLPGTQDASVSPDGNWIAFSVNTSSAIDNNDIWVVRTDGTGLRRIVEMPYIQNQPRWSPDGKWIYFLSGTGVDAHDVWRVNLATLSKEQITVGKLYHFELSISPNGVMAYSSNRSGNYEIYSQNVGEKAEQLTNHAALDGGPSWSSSGEQLVFHSLRGGSLNIWRLEPSAREPVQVTFHEQGARSPVWGPPGSGL